MVTVNDRDYLIEIPGDGQTPARAVPATPSAVSPPAVTSSAAAAARIIPSMPDPNSNAVYRVQVGAYANRNIAREAFDRLRAAGFSPAYEPHNNLHRVVVSGVRAADIPQVARRLGAAGFPSAWIRKEN
jgi:cell division septation protein DedD